MTHWKSTLHLHVLFNLFWKLCVVKRVASCCWIHESDEALRFVVPEPSANAVLHLTDHKPMAMVSTTRQRWLRRHAHWLIVRWETQQTLHQVWSLASIYIQVIVKRTSMSKLPYARRTTGGLPAGNCMDQRGVENPLWGDTSFISRCIPL